MPAASAVVEPTRVVLPPSTATVPSMTPASTPVLPPSVRENSLVVTLAGYTKENVRLQLHDVGLKYLQEFFIFSSLMKSRRHSKQ